MPHDIAALRPFYESRIFRDFRLACRRRVGNFRNRSPSCQEQNLRTGCPPSLASRASARQPPPMVTSARSGRGLPSRSSLRIHASGGWLGGRESTGSVRGSKGRSITYSRSCSGSVIYALSVAARDFRSFSEFFQLSRCDVTRHVTRENSIARSHAPPASDRVHRQAVQAWSCPSSVNSNRHSELVRSSNSRIALFQVAMRSARGRACLTRDTRTILKGSLSVVRNSLPA
jgi:hypothetical protein